MIFCNVRSITSKVFLGSVFSVAESFSRPPARRVSLRLPDRMTDTSVFL